MQKFDELLWQNPQGIPEYVRYCHEQNDGGQWTMATDLENCLLRDDLPDFQWMTFIEHGLHSVLMDIVCEEDTLERVSKLDDEGEVFRRLLVSPLNNVSSGPC